MGTCIYFVVFFLKLVLPNKLLYLLSFFQSLSISLYPSLYLSLSLYHCRSLSFKIISKTILLILIHTLTLYLPSISLSLSLSLAFLFFSFLICLSLACFVFSCS